MVLQGVNDWTVSDMVGPTYDVGKDTDLYAISEM